MGDMSLTALTDYPGLFQQSSVKTASVADEDADLLFSIWKNSQADADEKTYAVPPAFSNNDILRLKAAGLVSGDMKSLTFTSRANVVIKNMALSETNKMSIQAVKKPYSVILAEMKKPAKIGKVASTDTKVLPKATEGATFPEMNKSAAKNVPVPPGHELTKKSQWVKSVRLFNNSPGHYKEYTVRIYKDPTKLGRFDVWAFNGKILAGQTPQPKAFGVMLDSATDEFYDVVKSKKAGGYHEWTTSLSGILKKENDSLPGIKELPDEDGNEVGDEKETPDQSPVAALNKLIKKKPSDSPAEAMECTHCGSLDTHSIDPSLGFYKCDSCFKNFNVDVSKKQKPTKPKITITDIPPAEMQCPHCDQHGCEVISKAAGIYKCNSCLKHFSLPPVQHLKPKEAPLVKPFEPIEFEEPDVDLSEFFSEPPKF